MEEYNLKKGLNPNVSVDCVIFGFDFEELKVLLIERGRPPAPDGKLPPKEYALPGDLIHNNENLDEAAQRVLSELTGLDNIFLEQFQVFGDPDRVRREYDAWWLKSTRSDPVARVITVAYFSLVKLNDYKPQPSSFANNAVWTPVAEVPRLGFDHNLILDKALNTLKNKIVNRPIGFELLPLKFTMSQLQRVYENILGIALDKRNFRRKIFNMDVLEALDEKQKGVPHKPARLYKFNKERYEELLNSDLVFAV